MSENEIQSIKEHLEQLTTEFKSFRKDLDRVIYCLLGDFEKNEGCGLLADHKQRGKEFEEFKGRVTDLESKIEGLENTKREALSWIAGAVAVVGVGVYLIEKFIK